MNTKIKKITLSAMFIALGIILPFVTGQIPEIGSMLLPMHIPVILGGLIIGSKYGAIVGIITPLLRSWIFTMPPILTAISMAFELCTYGFVSGYVYSIITNKTTKAIYLSLLISMISGRIVWGIVRTIMVGLTNTPFSFEIFISGALLSAIPGIILQLVLIPIIVITLRKNNYLK
ncbi:MAG: ECF transporter S component [Erysipelotrichales bacterium]|nr:ECF transporter S component [Erysipelotrichales bacterium]